VEEVRLSQVMHTATFRPDDSESRILADLACPCCGCHDRGDAHARIADNQLRVFCEDCGSFVTIVMSDEQVEAIQRLSIQA
jgi:Zn finger protein HypA/HybF involved in hydrogenase expression